jgi:hypothetical protein
VLLKKLTWLYITCLHGWRVIYQIELNGSFSNNRYVQCGIHQGSCLGTLPFSILKNDLPLTRRFNAVIAAKGTSTKY